MPIPPDLSRSFLIFALEESVKLQSHYARLLNMHDGGRRIPFENAEEWVDRLAKSKDSPAAVAGRKARSPRPLA